MPLRACTIAAGVLAVAAFGATGAAAQCEGQVQAQLERLQIDRGRVQSIFVIRQMAGNDDRRIHGYDGWVRLTDCAGALLIDLTAGCGVRQVYTRGQCSIPGVPGY